MSNKTYLNKIEKYKNLILLKQEAIKNKAIKELPKDFKPINNLIDINDIEIIENHITYYLIEDYNEKLVVFYANKGNLLGSKYATYILGVAYELGIFVPRVLSYAKYYFEKVNSDELKGLEYLNTIIPGKLEFNMTDDFLAFDPVKALIIGLEKVSTGSNNMPILDNLITGLELIKKSAQSNYAESLYILGSLYMDVGQDESRLFDKGSLTNLESRPYLFNEYMNKAVELGHEDAITLMATMHSYKGNSENKITGVTDDIMCVKYWGKLYELFQYKFVEKLGLYNGAPKLEFEFYPIRFGSIVEYIGRKLFDIAHSIINGNYNVIHSCNAIIGLHVAKMLSNDMIQSDASYDAYLPILRTTIKQLILKKEYIFAYQVWLIACKFNVYIDDINEIIDDLKVNEFEIKLHNQN